MTKIFTICLSMAFAVSCVAQTSAESKQQAAKKYLTLALPSTPLAKAFTAEVRQRKQTTPDFFLAADWPMRLADELALQILTKYTVVEQWGAGGLQGMAVAVAPADATEAGMTSLADRIRIDTRLIRIASVMIYDDPKAADMRRRIGKLTPAESKFYDRHFIASYIRNETNGVHEMEIHLSGLKPPFKTLSF